MRNKWKNTLTLLSAALLLMTLIPAAAFAVDDCDLWICGEEVTQDHLLGPGWSFDPVKHILQLDGFSYAGACPMYERETGTIYGGVNYYGKEMLYIVLSGENRISLEGMDGDPALVNAVYALSSAADIYFTGDGTLEITTGPVNGINTGIWARKNLIMNRGQVRVSTGGGILSYPLQCDGNLQAEGGRLDLTAGASNRPCGIMCGGEMIVRGGTVSAVCGQIEEADQTDESDRYSYGISVKGGFHMESGQVIAQGGDTGTLGSQMSIGLLVYGPVFMDGGSVSAQAGDANFQSIGCGCMEAVLVDGGELIAAGGRATGIFRHVSGALRLPTGIGSFGLLANSRSMNVEISGGTVALKAGKGGAGASIALRGNSDVIVSGGTLTAEADEAGSSIGVDNQGTLKIIKGVRKVAASGLSTAISGNVLSEIKGVGYSDTEGKKDKTTIDSVQKTVKLQYRRVQFPAITFN